LPSQVAPISGLFSVSINCGNASNCFQVHADGQAVIDPVFTASSGTVTSATANFCGGSGPACTAAQIARGHLTDVGAIEVGISTCNPINEMACSTYNCHQGTITAVASATSITVSPVCTANSSATAKSNNFYWGQDDGTALQSASAALFAATKTGPASLTLPCGIILTSLPPFIDDGVTNRLYGAGIQGCGPGTPTNIIPLPKMNCNTSKGCFITSSFSQSQLGALGLANKFRDILFNGYGIPDKDAAATYSNPTEGIYGGFLDEFDNVWVQGWDWNRSSATPVYGWNVQGATLFDSGSYAGGNFPALLNPSSSVPTNVHGGSFGGSAFNSVTCGNALGGTNLFGVYVNSVNATSFTVKTSYGLYNNGAVDCKMFGGTLGGGLWNDAGTTILDGVSFSNQANYDINEAGGVVKLSNNKLDANGNLTGGVMYDNCGNTPFFPTTLTMAGGTLINCGALSLSNSSAVTSSNPTINTDQNLIQLSLPAGYFNEPTQAVHVEGSGIYSSTAASSPALTFKAKLCTVSGCGSGTVVTLFNIVSSALNTTALTNATWNLEGTCVTNTTGATGNLVCHGKPGLTLDTGATLSTPDNVFADTNTATLANIDLTAALFLQFTVAQSVVGASNSYTQQLASIR
jgi:hypothetical protein